MENIELFEESAPQAGSPKASGGQVEEILLKVAAAAEAATETERQTVEEILNRAQAGAYGSQDYEVTPGMAALLFREHNTHNRDWTKTPGHPVELARRMTVGQWEQNGDPFRFYKNGILCDGQNRMVAQVLSGYTIHTGIVFGLANTAITTIDVGKRRDAAAAAQLEGITRAARKQMVVKMHARYWLVRGFKDYALKSETEVKAEILKHDEMLNKALLLGEDSCMGIAAPTFPDSQAQAAAYIMLRADWPAEVIRDRLERLQSGISDESEEAPEYVGSGMIRRGRERKKKEDALASLKQLGVAIFTMTQAVNGIKAVKSKVIKDAINHTLPDPTFKKH